MTSLTLSTATRYLLPLLLFLSVEVLLRGHNHPGGGFIGGIMAASAYTLFAFAHGKEKIGAIFRINPRYLILGGLILAMAGGLVPLFLGKSFLTGLWFGKDIPIITAFGTPLLFDTGIYLVVLGVILTLGRGFWPSRWMSPPI